MKRSFFILPTVICLLTSGLTLAILDTNNNGLSDFWEREYNAGELCSANFDPQADYDADGWTNDREAAAGTDPHDPNPPDRIIRPVIGHVPAVIGEINGVPVVITPEAITVSWPTLTGKQYTLLFSPDLTQGSWMPVEDPFVGNGSEVTYNFPISPADKCFWRVAVRDVDTDGDGLTDHEEHVFGTNPNLPMTFPGIPDTWLAANFPSAQGFDLNGYPDGDGINNAMENQLGLDPHHFDKIGPVNFGFDEEITDSPDMSFRDDYPSDLYDQTSIPGWNVDSNGNTEGWQAGTGQHIEIWDEDDGNPHAELQSHLGAHGLKQEFNMLPGSRYSFILRYKGRYEYDAYLHVDGLPAVLQGSKKVQSFMDDDEWDAYAEWRYAAACITAETGRSGLKRVTLSLVPKTTTTYGENGQEEITYGGFVDLVPVDIEPDADMAGVIGDVVESNKHNSTIKHFVTPKKSAELNQVYVLLKATGITAEQITAGHANQIVEWDGGEAVPNEPLKRRVKRDKTGTGATEVKIKLKQSETVAVQMNVWVTWATIETQDDTPKMKPASSDSDKLTLSGNIQYRYTCEPAAMFDLTADVPDLSRPYSVQAPGIHPWTGGPLWPGAPYKYDASRQFRAVSRSNVAAVQTALQVGHVDVPDYPADSIEGNDDPNLSGETRPYLPQGTTAIMRDLDDPNIELPHTLGSATPQATLVFAAQFREFARAQIGSKWYQCSDYSLSECMFRAKRENNKWVDNGSTFALGNTPFPPP